MHQFYCVYLLQSLPKPASFYVGLTPDPARRLRQHNGYISKGGAFRTRKNGFRPWIMVACVCGFPSKVAALQFELALQHPFQSRHIELKISKNSRSAAAVHHRMGNIRLLVEAPGFRRMGLEVWIFNDLVYETWEQNRFKVECGANLVRISFDEAFSATGERSLHQLTSAENDRAAQLVEVENASCYVCKEGIDVAGGVFSCYCELLFHPRCILQRFLEGSGQLIPTSGNCPSCGDRHLWAKVARQISMTKTAACGLDALKLYKPDTQLSQQMKAISQSEDHNSS